MQLLFPDPDTWGPVRDRDFKSTNALSAACDHFHRAFSLTEQLKAALDQQSEAKFL